MRDGFNPITLHKLGDSAQLDANEDYSAAGGYTRFVLAPAADEVYELIELIGLIHDDDADYNTFGNLPELSPDGVRIVIEDADGPTELVDLGAGAEVTKTEGWWLAGFDLTPLGSSSGATRGTRVTTQPFPERDRPILRGNENERLAVLIPAEDLSDLAFFRFIARVKVSNLN